MPGPLPDGEPAPRDGGLPKTATARLAAAGHLQWYFHVPYCRTRCGYCDFNTYTNAELGGGASAAAWATTAEAEVRLARSVLRGIEAPARTVFFGGGTPTRLPPADLGRVLRTVAEEFGIAPGAEITVEANPDDLDERVLAGLAEIGVTRVSVGMQSAVAATLRVLDRTHRAAQLPAVVQRIRRSGIPQFNIDLIYATPGETAEQWRRTLDAALDLDPDHVSAYCLGIEPGTRLGARVRAGSLPPVDPDDAADRYEACDEALAGAGLNWYEISNWSRLGAECRHNLGYWRGGDWWGAGPGAHSHIGGVRWWNRRHPRDWTTSLNAGSSPAQAREVLTDEQRRDERVLLGIRLAQGMHPADIPAGPAAVAAWIRDGLAEAAAHGRFRLTRRGRLLADRIAVQAVDGPVVGEDMA